MLLHGCTHSETGASCGHCIAQRKRHIDESTLVSVEKPQEMSTKACIHLRVMNQAGVHACEAVRSAGSAADLPEKAAAFAIRPAARCLAASIQTG
jgi:hypothetical protein